MEVAPAEIIVGGNSSLTMMYDTIVGGMLFGMPGGSAPWGDQGSVKFICPVPGYDRHFAICERLGVGMVTVPMTPDGPDMDAVEALVADDASVKGIWCVPKYSNPSGEVYSDDVVDRLANMQVAAPDFRVIWDNAYNVHHIGEGPAPLKNLLAACKNAGTPDRVLMFGSTSKLTLPGAGVAVLAASEANIQDALKKKCSIPLSARTKSTNFAMSVSSRTWMGCVLIWMPRRRSSVRNLRPSKMLFSAGWRARGLPNGHHRRAVISSVLMCWTVAHPKSSAWPAKPGSN